MNGPRIISGKSKGRRLRSVPGDSTRPITDRTKESLFNIIGPDINHASILDLFAGTGSVGIEALSRGADFACFIDIQWQAIETIRANIETTGFNQFSVIYRMDAFQYLLKSPDRNYDYVYIAPPQYKSLWKQAVVLLDEHPKWLTENAWVIIQIHPIEYEPITFQNLVEFDQRRYGSTLLVFLEYSGS